LTKLLIFRDCIKNAKESFENSNRDSNAIRSVKSIDAKLHISWDFAEQVHIPYSTQQVVCILFYFHTIFSTVINFKLYYK